METMTLTRSRVYSLLKMVNLAFCLLAFMVAMVLVSEVNTQKYTRASMLEMREEEQAYPEVMYTRAVATAGLR